MYSYKITLLKSAISVKIDAVKENILQASNTGRKIGIDNDCDKVIIENVDPYRVHDCKVIIQLN